MRRAPFGDGTASECPGSSSLRTIWTVEGAVIPRRAVRPLIITTVTRMSLAITISSPTRRVSTNIAYFLLAGSWTAIPGVFPPGARVDRIRRAVDHCSVSADEKLRGGKPAIPDERILESGSHHKSAHTFEQRGQPEGLGEESHDGPPEGPRPHSQSRRSWP